MTRVLHVLDHSLPLHSGYTFRTRAILKAQQAAGMEVRGVTGLRHAGEGPDVETVDGLTFHRTRGEAQGPVGVREWREIARFAEGVEAVVREWRPDIIHAHSPALCGHAALRVARRHGIPLVYEIRAFWEDAAVGNGTGREGSVKYRLTRALENHVVGAADAVFTICHGLRDDLIARGFAAGKIGISPNGVDMALFGEPVSRDNALADELGISGGPVIGFIGSFYDYEGLDDLVAAMPRLLAREPDARLLLVGGGPMDAALRAQAAASPAAHAIRFTGRVPHDQVERYYSLVDVLAYPRKASRLTDLVTPLKPLEAMAQRRLVAASDVGGHRELITHGVTGTLFPPDDPAALADALADLAADRADWDAMRARARVHVADSHDWARNVHRYQVVYQTLLGPVPDGALSAAA
ncbi:MAG: glycosyltransferase, exosortase A system-associated [Sphingomonadales bacterium]|nr:glycosyltransferase, exosortase A system-associated [Sphingomonadales bacterium]MBD3774486.1 glycosyltransferase, exosortase A system-associated [Paracoccaceae bacterium]